ncbi:MAG: hypothetical protein LBF37_01680 [Rickettsiales bacterium]|jgi:hypothetical protein|nr:hypothetical protein [Rickettsiales bacterium]
MIEFPRSIKDGDIELVKLNPTFENATKLFELVDKNRDFLGKWLQWVDYVKTPEDEFTKVKSVSETDSPEYFILYKGELAGVTGFVSVKEKQGFCR